MITKEEIENLATLSKLYVTQSEIPLLQKELEQMIDFAQGVNKALKDTDNVNTSDCTECVEFREDIARESADSSAVLSNAPISGDGYFIVRKSE